MNKLTKAGIATAAGIALLMGGAGTLAYWNDEANLFGSSNTISAGHLKITNVSTGVWTNDADAVIDISNYKIVPGETLTYTSTIDVDVEGDALDAVISLGSGSIAAANPANAADLALQGYLGTTAGIAVSGSGITGTGPYTITNDAESITVVLTITFPIDETDGGKENAAMKGKVNLSNVTIELRQV